jgi:biotin synthase
MRTTTRPPFRYPLNNRKTNEELLLNQQDYLILTKTTSHMLKAEKIIKARQIPTELVPAPLESGTVCAIAIKIPGKNIEEAKQILESHNIPVIQILPDKKMKLAILCAEK